MDDITQARHNFVLAFQIWVDQNGNHLAPVVLTSMVKDIPLSVQRVIGEAVSGNFVGGERYFGLTEGAVSYAVDADNRITGNSEKLNRFIIRPTGRRKTPAL